MKFLLDVSASSRSMRATLTRLGHDVLSASDMTPGAADEYILALAAEEGRVLVTEDKDFGELVFVRGWLTRASFDSLKCGLKKKWRQWWS